MSHRSVDQKTGAASEKAMLTPAQLRAARALIGWSRTDLAKKAGTGSATIQQFEWGGSNPKMQTVLNWRRALQQAGVIFIEDNGEHGPGVCLRDSETRQRGKR